MVALGFTGANECRRLRHVPLSRYGGIWFIYIGVGLFDGGMVDRAPWDTDFCI